MTQSAIRNPQSTIPDEPSAWHVGFDKRELAKALTDRMGWKHSSYGVEAIYNNPMNTDQIADVLGALDQRDKEIERVVKVAGEMFRLLRHISRGHTEPSGVKLAEWRKIICEAERNIYKAEQVDGNALPYSSRVPAPTDEECLAEAKRNHPEFANCEDLATPRNLEDEVFFNAPGSCFHCGFNPCRCAEVDAVADGLRRQEGVKITG